MPPDDRPPVADVAGVADSEHPIPIGAVVTVLRVAPRAPPFIEGRAVIVGPALGRDRYRVVFTGDPAPKERLVPRNGTDDPARMLGIRREFCGAAAAEDSCFSDFFPDGI